MLKLSPKKTEPYWLDIVPGVRFKVRPVEPLDIVIARAQAGEGLKGLDDVPTQERNGIAAVGIVVAMAHRAIVEWEGVGDEGGNPLPVTAEAIDLAFAHFAIYRQFDEKYANPAFALSDEKNE